MSLQFLDVSQNLLDKKAVEYLASALATKPSLVSLRMDDCLLRASALETLGRFRLIARARPVANNRVTKPMRCVIRHCKIYRCDTTVLALLAQWP